MVPEFEKCVLQKHGKAFIAILCVLLLALALYINLLIQAVLFRSLELKMHVILFNTGIASSVALCLVLSATLLPSADIFMLQFLNALIQSNQRWSKHSGRQRFINVADISLSRFLKQGIHK